MRRGVVVAVVGGLLLCAGLAAYRRALPPRQAPPHAPANLTLTFLHYTNDFSGIRSQMYKLPDDSDKSMAVFRLNITQLNGGVGFSWGQIQLQQPNGWSPDVNHMRLLPGCFVAQQSLPPCYILTVPVPAGTNAWRYSVPWTYYPNRPVWQQEAIKLLNQVGFNIRAREYPLTSPEITR